MERLRLAVALFFLASSQLVSTAAGATPPIDRETRRLHPVDVACVLDDSGSEFGPGGTDPFALRYRACRLAAEYLASTATDGLDHRFGVVSFGSAAVLRTPRLLALPGRLDQVDRALSHPTPLGDTNYAAGMTAATRLLGPPSAGRQQIVLMMGDGEPDVPGQSQTQSFADIRRAVGQSAADVLVFQADPAGRAPDLESRWAHQGVDTARRIANLRDGSLERAYIDALRRAIGMDRGDELQLTHNRPTATIDVPNYLEAVTLTWFAPGDATLRITPAGGGGPRRTLPSAAVGTRSFPLPHGGRWQVELVRGSGAQVAVDLIPVAAAVRSPGRTAPLGRDLVVEATFATTAGTTVADVSSDPRYFGAVVTDPTGRTDHVELRRDDRGRYRATRAVPLDRVGAWRVDLVMKSRDGNVIGQAGSRFTVAATPWLSIDRSAVRSRRALEVPITLHQGTATASASTVLGEDPQAAVMATIVGPDGRAVETVRARWVGGAHFIAHFQRHLADGDEAWVRAALDSQQADGRTVADATEAAVTARPSSGALWAERIRVGLLLVLAGAITAITAYAVWLLRRPALDARVDLGPFGGPSGLRIDRGRWRRVDGHGLISVWLWAGRDGAIHRSQAVIPWPFRTDEVPTTRRSTPARTSGRPAPTGRYAPRQS